MRVGCARRVQTRQEEEGERDGDDDVVNAAAAVVVNAAASVVASPVPSIPVTLTSNRCIHVTHVGNSA